MFLKLLDEFSRSIQTSFSITLPDAKKIDIGNNCGDTAIQVVINNKKGLGALESLNELKICEAYIYKDIDFLGKVDMMKLLEITKLFSKKHYFISLWAKFTHFLRDQIHINKKSIEHHYEFDDDFYLTFLDKSRAYSQGIFLNDEETLDTAILRKLEFAMKNCKLAPGSRVLDIGAGWGCAVEYLGNFGIDVDALTISERSANFITNLINQNNLANSKVYKIDFFDFEPPRTKYYDAVFSLGTLEHLPDYERVLDKCSKLLKKGGYAYFDASATDSTRLVNSHFIHKHIFPGNHVCLNIYRFVKAVEKSKFNLISLHNDTHNYYLTLKAWAQNLDNNKEIVVQRWGEEIYKKFQIYLWGCCFSMAKNELQAYRIVLRKK